MNWLKRFLTNFPTRCASPAGNDGPGLSSVVEPIAARSGAAACSPVVSFRALENAFFQTTEVGILGSTLLYRPCRQGSFREERGRLGRFIKCWLIDRQLDHLWRPELVGHFRQWLAIDARPLQPGETSTDTRLVG
jgi:hypothetical protein